MRFSRQDEFPPAQGAPRRRPAFFTPSLVQPSIVWGGLGAGGWVILEDFNKRQADTVDTLLVGAFCFIIALGIYILRDRFPINKG